MHPTPNRPGFPEWLAARLGTRQWCVARKSKRLVEKGYTVFLSQRTYSQYVLVFNMEQTP
jgi:hypothetical protein